ncbi:MULTISPECIES: leucine zipper domain-containing protein [Pseudomonas aeruginosa group]|uniref:DNA-binding domain-containing protein n=1 Tax=Pseudomonas nitroreducens TaxID=46680 RepID=A0A6G6J641_PSENT|nr:hypothetical protein G5B91_06800 [Pseudomonas nitroreducens]HCE6396361.1 hypothetical protein [Pseudomonas aeruginosa]
MDDQGLRVEETAQAAYVSARTAYKWFRCLEEAGFMDRSSRPHPCPLSTAKTLIEQLIARSRAHQTYRSHMTWRGQPAPALVFSNNWG